MQNSVSVWRKGMSQGQGTHCCLFRRQSGWWLAAHTLGASSVVWLPCSRICLALKAGCPILLVNPEGLRVQGWWAHANLSRNRVLNQNVHLLFSNKSCTFQVHWDLPAKALPSLHAYLWESQMMVGQLQSEGGVHERSWPMASLSEGLKPGGPCTILTVEREVLCVPQTPSPLAGSRPPFQTVFPDMALIETKYRLFVKLNVIDYITRWVAIPASSLRFGWS